LKIDRNKFLATVALLAGAGCEIKMVQPRASGGPQTASAAPTAPAPTSAPTTGPAAEGARGPTVEGSRGPTAEGARGPAAEGWRGPTSEGSRGPTAEGGPTREGGPAHEGGPTGEGAPVDAAQLKACDAYAIGPCGEGMTVADYCKDGAAAVPAPKRPKYFACMAADIAPARLSDPTCAAVGNRCASARGPCKPLAEVYEACYSRSSSECMKAPEVKKQDECWRDVQKGLAGVKDPAARKQALEAGKTKCGAAGSARTSCLSTKLKTCEPLEKASSSCWAQAEKACEPPAKCQAPIANACTAGSRVVDACVAKASK
jgi:hypothetical protein